MDNWIYPYLSLKYYKPNDYKENEVIIPKTHTSTGVEKPFIYGHFYYDTDEVGSDYYMQFVKVMCDESKFNGETYYSFHHYSSINDEAEIYTFKEDRIGLMPTLLSSDMDGMDIILPDNISEAEINVYKKAFITRILGVLDEGIYDVNNELVFCKKTFHDVRKAVESQKPFKDVYSCLDRREQKRLIGEYTSFDSYSDNMKSIIVYQAVMDWVVSLEMEAKKYSSLKDVIIGKYYSNASGYYRVEFHDDNHKVWEQEEIEKIGCYINDNFDFYLKNI